MTAAPGEPAGTPAGGAPAHVQARGTVLTVRRVDAYHAMTVIAPGIAARFRPGQFVAVAVGGPHTAMLLRRAFSIHEVRPDHGGTVEFVFAVTGPGTRWLSERRTRDTLDVAALLRGWGKDKFLGTLVGALRRYRFQSSKPGRL